MLDGNELAALIAPASADMIPLIGLASILALIAYTGVGLYNPSHKYGLLTKIRRVILVNVALLAIIGPILSLSALPPGMTTTLLLTTIIGSTVLLTMARGVSVVLRSEDRRSRSVVPEQPDENNVLVIGGAGYIGSALVKKLLDVGLQVAVLDAMHFGEETLSHVAGHPIQR